ncbi:MAG: DUF4433 domain-containing protein [Cyanobacteriota bacterium]
MPPPPNPKIYHIPHADRLPSVITDGFLYSDAIISRRDSGGTVIGMGEIKRRRLEDLTLASHPDLHVGECVPFYFCPRSIMLFMIYKRNHPNLLYTGGQDPVVHLEFDLKTVANWADGQKKRWAITKGNAGSRYFEDFGSLESLNELNWPAIQARQWNDPAVREHKQSEFLVEEQVAWHLVERIGVQNQGTRERVEVIVASSRHRPPVEIQSSWYY